MAATHEGRHEIWARVAWAGLDMAKRGGIDASEVLRGLPFDEAELRRRKRVAWDDYVTMVEHVAAHVGGAKGIEALTVAQFHHGVPEVARVARALVSPRLLYRFVAEVMDPLLFPMVEFQYEDLGGNRVRVATYLAPGARPAPMFQAANTGAWSGLACHLGFPPAKITVCEMSGMHAIWEIDLPPARTLVRRAGRFALRMVLGAEADGTPVSATLGNSEPDSLEVRLDDAQQEWHLTPRQRDVLALVVQGRSNKEIAHALACAENTVELHLTQLFKRSNRSSRAQLIAAFWSSTWGFPQ